MFFFTVVGPVVTAVVVLVKKNTVIFEYPDHTQTNLLLTRALNYTRIECLRLVPCFFMPPDLQVLQLKRARMYRNTRITATSCLAVDEQPAKRDHQNRSIRGGLK